MAAPSLLAVSAMYGRTKGLVVTTSAQDLLLNTAASGKVLKVNSIILSNVDGVSSVDATVAFVDASPALTTRLCFTRAIAQDTYLELLSKPIYLEEGDRITALASANGDLEATISYEEIS